MTIVGPNVQNALGVTPFFSFFILFIFSFFYIVFKISEECQNSLKSEDFFFCLFYVLKHYLEQPSSFKTYLIIIFLQKERRPSEPFFRFA